MFIYQIKFRVSSFSQKGHGMPQSRIKKKNQHLKKKNYNFYKPTSKAVSTVLLAGTLTTTAEILLDLHAPKAEAATSTNQQNFIETIASSAKPVADANGLYPSVMIAQAILESNWGQSSLSKAPYYNLFGIQGRYQGKSVSLTTQEYIDGKYVTKKMPFRQYPSHKESFQDNARVLKTTNFGSDYFYRAAWRANAATYQQATAALTGKYATSPIYGQSLNTLISQYNLTRFDGVSTSNSTTSTASNTATTTQSKTYTVKSGDTLWGISQKNNVTVQQIKSWNKLTKDTIFVGQKLNLYATKTISTASTNTASKTSNSTASSTKKTTPTKTTTVKVVSGNTLSGLAAKYKTSVSQLKSWNNLKSDLILVGQKLIVAKTTTTTNNQTTAKTTNTNSTTSKASTSSTKIHKVVSGDSLWKLAQTNKVSVQQIKSWNHLSSDLILVGQYLRVK